MADSRARVAPSFVTRACGAALLLALVAGDALAQQAASPTGGTRPRAAGRDVRVFDFEEQATNPGEVPQYWYRNQDNPSVEGALREGFPSSNRARLSYVGEGGMAASGEGSVMLPTTGGSTSLVLGTGVIAIFPDTDYRILANVRTQGLTSARAAIICTMLDVENKPIEGSRSISEMVISNDAWRQVVLDLPNTPANVAWIQLELVLLQAPQQRALVSREERLAAQFAINRDDIQGAAYFDDVRVVQLPRVQMRTESKGNVLSARAPVKIGMVVRDLASEPLTMDVEVVDASGVRIDAMQRDLGGVTLTTSWQPRLTKRGWYRARMRLTNPRGELINAGTLDFAWIDTNAPGAGGTASVGQDHARFGVALTTPLDRWLEDVPELTSMLHVGSVSMPLWTQETRADTVLERAQRLSAVARKLVSQYTDVTFSFAPLPKSLAMEARIDPSDAWTMMTGEQSRWMAFAQDAFEKLGMNTTCWQLGTPGFDQPYWMRRGGQLWPKEAIAGLEQHLPGVVLGLPSDIRHAWDPRPILESNVPIRLVARVPAEMSAASVRSAAEGWVATLTVAPRMLSTQAALEAGPANASPRERINRLVRQGVECWRMLGADPSPNASAPFSMTLMDPWEWPGDERGALEPTPELAAWGSLIARLSGRRIVGKFPYDAGNHEDGIACWILSRGDADPENRSGALVAWNEHAPPGKAVIEVPVSANDMVRVIDVFGNPVHVDEGRREAGTFRVVRVPVSDMPVFIEGVDVGLARFVAGVSVTPTLIDAAADPASEHNVVITNPWPFGISGVVSILEPGGFSSEQADRSWRIQPRSSSFVVGPGETVKLPFTVSCGVNEEAGEKPFLFSVKLSAEASSGVLLIPREAQLGLKDFRLDITSTTLAGGSVAIEAIVANVSRRPQNFELTALAPGSARQRATIANLAPGQQMLRRFLFADSTGALAGQRVRVIAKDSDTDARLVAGVDVDAIARAKPSGAAAPKAPSSEGTPR